jgi:hypothetical protein
MAGTAIEEDHCDKPGDYSDPQALAQVFLTG